MAIEGEPLYYYRLLLHSGRQAYPDDRLITNRTENDLEDIAINAVTLAQAKLANLNEKSAGKREIKRTLDNLKNNNLYWGRKVEGNQIFTDSLTLPIQLENSNIGEFSSLS